MIGNSSMKPRKFLAPLLAIAALCAAYCLATGGISTLLMTTMDSAAQAHGGGHGGGGHGGGGHGGGGHWGGHGGYWGGHGGYGGYGYGRGRFWHGRWWGYGVGPCWRWTPAGWVWICW
jgi:hypothetical protein